MLLPVLVIPENYPPCNLLKGNPQKDNFHKLIYGIDKRDIRCIVDSTIQTRPSLSKGGDGWRKTLRTSPVQLEFSS
jgi:hypothetical protein